MAQARALARRLAGEPLAAIYSSDLGRAIHTARLATAAHDLALRMDAGLRERHAGLLSGLTRAEIEARFPGALEQSAARPFDWMPPEGESLRQALARVCARLDAVAREWDGRAVLVVTHGGVIRVLAALARGGDWPHLAGQPHPANCSLSHFAWRPGAVPVLRHFDEHGYLDGTEAVDQGEMHAG